MELAGLMGIDGETCGVEKVRLLWRKAKEDLRKEKDKGDDSEDHEDKSNSEKGKPKEETSDGEKVVDEVVAGTFDRDEARERLWRKWYWALEVC